MFYRLKLPSTNHIMHSTEIANHIFQIAICFVIVNQTNVTLNLGHWKKYPRWQTIEKSSSSDNFNPFIGKTKETDIKKKTKYRSIEKNGSKMNKSSFRQPNPVFIRAFIIQFNCLSHQRIPTLWNRIKLRTISNPLKYRIDHFFFSRWFPHSLHFPLFDSLFLLLGCAAFNSIYSFLYILKFSPASLISFDYDYRFIILGACCSHHMCGVHKTVLLVMLFVYRAQRTFNVNNSGALDGTNPLPF